MFRVSANHLELLIPIVFVAHVDHKLYNHIILGIAGFVDAKRLLQSLVEKAIVI